MEVQHATPESLPAFREALAAACRAPDGPFLVVNYARAALGQTGDGHFSPVGAWHEGEDRLLVLDVARFKYPPHWVKVESLWAAMTALDPSSDEPRGWATLKAAANPPPTRAEIEAFREKLQGLSARPVPCCPPAGANA